MGEDGSNTNKHSRLKRSSDPYSYRVGKKKHPPAATKWSEMRLVPDGVRGNNCIGDLCNSIEGLNASLGKLDVYSGKGQQPVDERDLFANASGVFLQMLKNITLDMARFNNNDGHGMGCHFGYIAGQIDLLLGSRTLKSRSIKNRTANEDFKQQARDLLDDIDKAISTNFAPMKSAFAQRGSARG